MDRNWALTAHLADMKQEKPAFFLAGSADPVVLMTPPSIMDGFVTDLRGSVLVDGAGHWVQQEKPAETNGALLGFLAEVWPAS
jgi:pimeloyl-ACP methyl ester carboxylesterase